MSKFKIVGMMALIAFAIGIFFVGEAAAGESGKMIVREVYYTPTIHILKVPDVEGHINFLGESKGIASYEKWGDCLLNLTQTGDLISGEGPSQGYVHVILSDGSTYTRKFEGKLVGRGRTTLGSALAEGTLTYIKGTGKLEGIQGAGTYKCPILAPGQFYCDVEMEYTLP